MQQPSASHTSDVSYPSTHFFNPKQHLPIKSTVQLQLKCSKTDQFRRGATIIIGASKQDICPSADHKAVSTPQKACTQIRCYIPAPRQFSAYKTKTPNNNTQHTAFTQAPSGALRYQQPVYWVSLCSGRGRIPMKIIKAMGRWSSDCYRSYIRTPHRILRSLTSKLCAS